MNNVIPFPGVGKRSQSSTVHHFVPRSPAADKGPAETAVWNSSEEIRAIEEGLAGFMDPDALFSKCSRHLNRTDPEADWTWRAEHFEGLDELVVFSPEIQREELSDSVSREPPRPMFWGDVFLKTGPDYRFLFTVYTKEYTRNQLLYFGERIEPSAKDITLDKDGLSRSDIIRAVIKWMNMYCGAAVGKPVLIEQSSVLKTLVCDPAAEVHCPESVL